MQGCLLCAQGYSLTETVYYPRMLRCGHSFCAACLETRTQAVGYFECVRCKTISNEESVISAPVNYDLLAALSYTMQLLVENNQLKQALSLPLNVHKQFAPKPQLATNRDQKCYFEACQNKRVQLSNTDMFCSLECQRAWDKS